mgnify:CR=1 FL=1
MSLRPDEKIKMNKKFAIAIIAVFCTGFWAFAQDAENPTRDTVIFSGQMSMLGNFNFKNKMPLQFIGRYIPQLDYGILFPVDRKLDFEVSADLHGAVAFSFVDTVYRDGSVEPYRIWTRFSSRQWEVRLGLQKINFGSASLLRPLMWFDQIDPRDPLQITSGVWGLLFRYYFKNNANLWFWGLYGNNKSRPWDIGKTYSKYPECGGRLQIPVPKGEIGLSSHFRMADLRDFDNILPGMKEVPESRIGLDAKWDLGAGIWLEGTWINKSKMAGIYTNQEIFNIGVDNTFRIGNGLTMIFEQLLVSNDEHAFGFRNNKWFSALSLSYPLGLSDNLGAIVYFEWENKKSYNFINWNHRFQYFTLYLMGYWNPDEFYLPLQASYSTSYSGPGIQVMLVYNH